MAALAAAAPRLVHPAFALAFKLALAPLLLAQAVRTRRRAPVLPEAAGPREGRSGASDGTPIRILVTGDSSAAGVGVAHQDQAVLGYLVRTLAKHSAGPVEWRLHARSGLSTREVHAMLLAEPPAEADVVVVVTGVNDVIDQIPARRALAHRAALADWLLGQKLARHVVFAPLPPMHQFPLLPEPLRRVIGTDARRHDQALARWAATRGDVSVAAIAIELSHDTMASDGFHPGEPVYRACGEALGLHVARTLG
jgi:lysophospholipase L1-like esterase